MVQWTSLTSHLRSQFHQCNTCTAFQYRSHLSGSIWNSFPVTIVCSPSVSIFKKSLKNYLIERQIISILSFRKHRACSRGTYSHALRYLIIVQRSLLGWAFSFFRLPRHCFNILLYFLELFLLLPCSSWMSLTCLTKLISSCQTLELTYVIEWMATCSTYTSKSVITLIFYAAFVQKGLTKSEI